MKTTLTAARLRELLHYDPATGLFRWRSNGSPAGTKNKAGYIRISVDGKVYRAHRLVLLYMTGEMPPQQVDHRNRIRDDNRYDNLRPATHGQNRANALHTKPSASGHKGVYWAAHANCWRTELTLRSGGRRIKKVLGYFTDPALAAEFRELAGRLIWGDYYRAA